MAPRILLFGADGQVGRELAPRLNAAGYDLIALNRAKADFGQPESLRAVIRAYSPSLIINAAAFTAVDQAEAQSDLAHLVNAVAPGVLAQEAQSSGAAIVHYSTDYVFSGAKAGPYAESDTPEPLSIYGQSKLAGERAIAAVCARHLIIRTSWIMSPHGNNFLKTILRLATDRNSLRIVADQKGAPTSAMLIAAATMEMVRQSSDKSPDDNQWGIYHLAAAGEVSWCGYARRIVEAALERGFPLKAKPETIEPITTAEYPLPARRPANSRLDTRKFQKTYGVSLPDWTLGVAATLDMILTNQKESPDERQ